MNELVKLELTDSEWMALIDGTREDGLLTCCANVSALRDVLITAARAGGVIHRFDVERFRTRLSWVMSDHDIDQIPAMVKVREQLGAQGFIPHTPDELAEMFD